MSDGLAELIRQMGADLGGKIEALRGEFATRLGGLEDRLGGLDGRLGGLEGRLERVEREQARLRVDLLGQTERILDEQSAIRGDMRIVIARVDRLDATVQLAMPELRALHDSFNRMSERVRKLEDGHS